MMKLVRIFVMICALSMVNAAHATKLRITFTGVVYDNPGIHYYDGIGLFGTPGGLLDNQTFSAVFLLDTEAASYTLVDDEARSVIGGGTAHGLPDIPALIGSVTIGTGTYGDLGHYNSSASLTDHDDQHSVAVSVASRPSETISLALGSAYDFLPTGSFGTPISYGHSVGRNANGNVYASVGGVVTSAQLDVRTVLVEPLAVPEPATWMTMIGGFGLVGSGLRRRMVETLARQS